MNEQTPKWYNENILVIKQEQENKNRLELLKSKARERPNAPFILVEGKGYFEVPAWIVSNLTDPGITLGTPFGSGFEPARKAWDYLYQQGIISNKNDFLKILWAGTAIEALNKINTLPQKP